MKCWQSEMLPSLVHSESASTYGRILQGPVQVSVCPSLCPALTGPSRLPALSSATLPTTPPGAHLPQSFLAASIFHSVGHHLLGRFSLKILLEISRVVIA